MDQHEEFDEGAQGVQDVHAMFGRVVTATIPTVGFTPDDIAAGGRARLRRLRTVSVVGGAASVAALAVAVGTIGVGARNPDGVRPGFTPTAPTAPTTARTTGPTEPPSAGGPTSGFPFGDLSPADTRTANQAFGSVVGDLQVVLDPQHRHLVWGDSSSDVYRTGADHHTIGITEAALWSADGDATPYKASVPYVGIQLDIDAADSPSQLGPRGSFTQNGEPVAWQHKDSKMLNDGSTVTWVWTVLPSGSEMAAERVYPDGKKISIHVSDAAGWPDATVEPYTPFPFTTTELVAAVSDPFLKLPNFP